VLRTLEASLDQSLVLFLATYIRYNLLLAAFNMLPIPPLDGFNVLMGLVSDFWVQRLAPLRTAGAGLLLLLVFVAGRYIYPWTITPMFLLFARLVGFPV
jgi:Zn-dependent protease